ncbi:MAG: hypothetical protein CUN53_02600 [Phototrophicales bacterium]|nr:MAG: hypothetical protein CUN53_02600 [Phototrophicales bacterium]
MSLFHQRKRHFLHYNPKNHANGKRMIKFSYPAALTKGHRRMRFRRVELSIVLVLLLLARNGAASAQSVISARPPTIIALRADVGSIALDAVEDGNVSIMLMWRIEDFDDVLRIGLDQLIRAEWVSILEEGETLAPIGTRATRAVHPGDFAPLTYRMTVSSSSGELLTQQIITIPYATEDALPFIDMFESDTPGLDTAALLQRNALATVRWSVRDRRPGSQIRFEQVLSEQDVILVELPRQDLWLPSEGEIQVAPDVPLTEEIVRLRMSVFDLLTGEVYHMAELTLPLTGVPLPIPGLTPALTATDAPAEAEPTPEPTASAETTTNTPTIVSFTALPTSARSGESIIVSWNVENAANISIQEQEASGAEGLLYIELPPIGALSLRMPENAPGMIYILRARSADGTEITSQVVVARTS